MLRCTIPEGVEVKLSSEIVSSIIKGNKIIGVETYSTSRYSSSNPEGFQDFKKELSKDDSVIYVTDIQVRGKFMYWTFSNGWHMFCTFGMSGQWSPVKGKHPCFSIKHISANSEENLYFNDPRHFGTIKFTNNSRELSDKLRELGWDPMSMPLDKNIKWISAQLSKSTKSISEVLMNQNVFSGVGNYIRAEALYLAKLSPWRKANKLSQDEIKVLCEAIIDVMNESYKHQGATLHTYKSVYGEEGKYSTFFKVYSQKNDPLGHKIITEQTPDKRTIHWCPEIQK